MREIIISRNDLLEAINKTSVIANNKYRFLNLFWFYAGTGDTTKGTELTVCTSNQHGIAIKYHAAADITNDTDNPIKFCLPVLNLKKMLRLLPEQPLKLECHSSQLEIIHENGSFIIPYSEATDDYFKTPIKSPDIEAEIRHTIEIPDMRRYLDKTEAFMADDELRPVMSGILFKWVGDSHSTYSHLNVVSTDGHVLALVESKNAEMVPPHEIVLPRDTIKVLRRVLPKVGWIEIRWKKEKARRLSVIDSNRKVVMEIETELVDGRYPNYPAVLPTTTNLTIKVDRMKLLASIKRMSLFANEKSNMVEFRLNGDNTISLESGDYDYGTSSTEKVPAEYDEVVPESCCHFGFRGSSVSKILSLIPTENVLIKMRDKWTGCLFTQDDTDGDKLTYLLMPMMVD